MRDYEPRRWTITFPSSSGRALRGLMFSIQNGTVLLRVLLQAAVILATTVACAVPPAFGSSNTEAGGGIVYRHRSHVPPARVNRTNPRDGGRERGAILIHAWPWHRSAQTRTVTRLPYTATRTQPLRVKTGSTGQSVSRRARRSPSQAPRTSLVSGHSFCGTRRARRNRVLPSSEAALYQLSPQPLRQLHAVHEAPPIATAATYDRLAIGFRMTARGASELPNERQVLRVLAGAHAAALKRS
jgi:hypothetical protein